MCGDEGEGYCGLCGSVVCGVVWRRGEMSVCLFVWGDGGVGIVIREMSRCVVGDVYGGWLCVQEAVA
jgi:hypothetical protein